MIFVRSSARNISIIQIPYKSVTYNLLGMPFSKRKVCTVDVLSYRHSVILLFDTLERLNENVFIHSIISIFQSFAWSSSRNNGVGLRAPYIVDVTKITFEYLDALLRRVSEDLDGTRDWPPPAQEKECIAVAALNLLRLQVRY